MNTSDLALVDTNVLVYAADQNAKFHEPAKKLRDQGFQGKTPLAVTPQVLLEFYAVITDPARVQNPITPQEATAEVEKYLRSPAIEKIYPGDNILQSVIILAKKYNLSRQRIFDLYIVATMLTNNMTRIYTYNSTDFERFGELEVLTP